MSALFIVFPLALLIAAAAVAAFIWSVRSGQFDDLDTPPLRMLHDEEAARREKKSSEGDSEGSEPAVGDDDRTTSDYEGPPVG